jgi:hypothetical protein
MKNQKESPNKIRFRTIGVVILGSVIFFSGLAIWVFTQDTPPPEAYFYSLLSIWMLCIFVSSVFVVKYKEMPRTGGLPSITGPVAVVGGVFSLLISGFAFVYAVYEVVSRIFK